MFKQKMYFTDILSATHRLVIFTSIHLVSIEFWPLLTWVDRTYLVCLIDHTLLLINYLILVRFNLCIQYFIYYTVMALNTTLKMINVLKYSNIPLYKQYQLLKFSNHWLSLWLYRNLANTGFLQHFSLTTAVLTIIVLHYLFTYVNLS